MRWATTHPPKRYALSTTFAADRGLIIANPILHRLKLKEFQKFDSASAALEEISSLVEGKVTPKLSSLLDSIKDEKKASLAVADPKLGTNARPALSKSGYD